MNNTKNWKKEVARDIIALGSIPFYTIILIRVLALPGEFGYLFQFIFAAAVFFLSLILFKPHLHLGFGLIAAILTSIHYNKVFYTVFVMLFYLGMIGSSVYLKVKSKQIIKGVVFGGISALMGYLLALIIF